MVPVVPPVLRVVRPTNRLSEITALYMQGLGLRLLAEFQEESGLSGSILGHPKAPYHLEFTQHAGHSFPPAPTQENLLVFYLPDGAEWEVACQRMLHAGFRGVEAYNPYWDHWGRTFEDPDGYRVVLARRAWTA